MRNVKFSLQLRFKSVFFNKVKKPGLASSNQFLLLKNSGKREKIRAHWNYWFLTDMDCCLGIFAHGIGYYKVGIFV